MCAFSLPTRARRDELIRELWRQRVIMLASGTDSVRFRPALTVSRAEIDAAVAAVADALCRLDSRPEGAVAWLLGRIPAVAIEMP
jgi:4-aminobutyrate aminotransferase-like enzyme